ncbi:MAG: hypothetical protein AB1483_07090 [Candidatus Zixiibacteriota bacterium]
MSRLLAVIAIVVVLTTSQVSAQYSFDFCGGGARAEGMGKAYLAVSDEITGISWNPAGIYTIEKPVFGLSWGSLLPQGSSNVAYLPTVTHYDHSGSFNAIGSLCFAAPVRIKGHPFVGGVNYTRNFDVFRSLYSEGSIWQIYVPNENDPYDCDTSLTHVALKWQRDGGVNSINIGFGTRLYDKLSLGAAINIYTGRSLAFDDTHIVIEDSRYDPIAMQRGTLRIDSTVVDTNKFSGANFTVGFKFNGEKLAAALVVKTPFKLKVKYDRLVYSIHIFNGLPLDSETDTVYYMDNLIKCDMPWMVASGFALRLRENWLLAADAEFRAFKGGKINIRDDITINPSGENLETYIEYDPRWNNVFTVRVGSEYLKSTKFGTIPIRLGIGYQPVPEPNYDSVGKASKANGYLAALGSGIHWEQIHLDIAYSVSTIDVQYYGLYDYTNRNGHWNISFTGVF